MGVVRTEKSLAQTATVDFTAVGRVSKFTELEDIRLVEVTAKCNPTASGPLEASFAHDSRISNRGNEFLEVTTDYRFTGRSAEADIIEVAVTYLIRYTLNAPEPLADDDISEFAISNPVLHSWPFVREFLNGLTSRMGFPPFKLGVLHFVPQKAVEKKAVSQESQNPEPQSAQT
jgi:preprotein translocase subunit SecB